MYKSVALWLLWISFIAYAFVLAPPNQSDTFTLIKHLSLGQWDDINPLIIALFNLMGIWPLIYSALMYTDDHGQQVPTWLFAIASFAIGGFAILPYLALRQPYPSFLGRPGRLIYWVESRWLGGAIALISLTVLGYGIIAGDWGNFVEQWQQSRFIHVMSLDFCLLCSLVGALLGDDMARRGLSNRRIFWAIVLTPLLGILTYLCLRPPLQVQIDTVPGSNNANTSTSLPAS